MPEQFWWLVGFVATYMGCLGLLERWDILDFVVGMWIKIKRRKR